MTVLELIEELMNYQDDLKVVDWEGNDFIRVYKSQLQVSDKMTFAVCIDPYSDHHKKIKRR